MSEPTILERVFYPGGVEPWSRRALLAPLTGLSWAFGAGVWARGALYTGGVLRPERVEGVRVVSVGNLHVGGTGKTPAVLHLAQQLIAAGRRVGVLSRGYGRTAKRPYAFQGRALLPSPEEVGDEPLLIAKRCPEAWVFVGPDRRALARQARDEHGLDTLLLDDGFQHRKLARDEDLVVLDASAGLGNGHLLPRGPLREPPSALHRATLFWVREGAGPAAPLPALPGPVVRVRYAPSAWIEPSGAALPPAALQGAPVLALAGLARPAGFLATLRSLGTDLRGTALFPDHHRFSAAELREVSAKAEQLGARVVTTEKDAVRLPPSFACWQVRLEVQVMEGEAHLRRALGLSSSLG
ncbi:tetraacyldisaccharide 4'-kinase [Aggregicoccus sp. 17bor-14]|uniref:tetraacyldisaccharide 4'-kinase n=1 Tax=Myxococcaceae TaxID=31 RepID=UPI00129D0360|nr:MULTISPECIES: tetraacyldisaccharide 4'-kinase [Myxococcaceae]MBF5046315.1 tetraacyldisaccharide 4'-kinase [Simulacricoccus sp. 17bor-14]MRI92035.1 tetraacyldisaccharide 4'-kinase [Aggregicoccus sp. 17bor-14]